MVPSARSVDTTLSPWSRRTSSARSARSVIARSLARRLSSAMMRRAPSSRMMRWPVGIHRLVRVVAVYAWVRRHPRLVDGVLAAVLAFGGLGTVLAHGDLLELPLVILIVLPVVVLLYTLAAYCPRRVSRNGLILCLLGSVAAMARWIPGRMDLPSWIM